MKRNLGWVIVALLAACGGGGDTGNGSTPKNDASGFPADDPTSTNLNAMSSSLAQGISISAVAAYQVSKVSLAEDGQPGDRSVKGIQQGSQLNVPLVAKRDALVRVFVNPDAGWKAAPVTARLKIQLQGPTGMETRVFFQQQIVSAASTEADLTSTINIAVPGDALQPGAQYGVVLNQTGGGAAPASGGTSTARYPQDGSLDDMGVSGGGDVFHLVIVPLRYQADGSGRLPDTSDAQVALITDRFRRLYPAVNVDVQVHDPVTFSSAIQPSGAGFDTALQFIGAQRSKDQATTDQYYYGAFEPAADFGAFCGGGCVTGLSNLGAPQSCGIGYTGDESAWTMAHEEGHAHGLDHAPFCGATVSSGPNYWPNDSGHAGGHLGNWGYDSTPGQLVDPQKAFDVMSYCGPDLWISDFHYARLFTRIKADNHFYADHYGSYFPLHVAADGSLLWGEGPAEKDPGYLQYGEPRTVDVIGNDGHVKQVTAAYFPYDHLPGGTLMVPSSEVAGATSVRYSSRVIAARLP